MKILAIKFKFLGDVAISVSALRALRQTHPDAELHFLVSEEAVPVVEHIPWINKVWGYPRKKEQGTKGKAFAMIRALRKEKFDLSVDFVGNDRGAWISLLIGAKTRLGLVAPKGFWGRKYCYTHRIVEAPYDMHETERELYFLSKIGIPRPTSTEPELYSDPALREYAERVLPAEAIICHLSASVVSKEWPVDKWVEFYEQSPELQDRLVFTSGASKREKKLLEDLHSRIPKARVIKWVEFPRQLGDKAQEIPEELYWKIIKGRKINNTPSIAEPMALIYASAAVICGDTFIAHAAAGLGTPLVVIFGPTVPKLWNPGGNSVIVETDWCKCRSFFYKCTNEIHCLSVLPVIKVREALNQLLERKNSIEKATH